MLFKTMLAGKADPARFQFPLYASPKLDGVRAHVIGGEVVSRNLLPFRNPAVQKSFGLKKFSGLDGEFMVGDPRHPAAFRKTGVLNSLSGHIGDVRLHVFDDFSQPHLPFYARLERAASRAAADPSRIVLVPHELITCHADLETYEHQCLEAGYEGVMLRHPEGPYKYGRSTAREGYLLKVKRFEDGEAEIIGYEERFHNANEKTLVRNGKAVRNTRKEGKVATGMLGAFKVRDIKTGVEFWVGSGFTEAERIELWQNPEAHTFKIIKYQYFPNGSKDKPRFPTFKGFRDRSDI